MEAQAVTRQVAAGEDLESWRLHAARAFALILWLHVPVVALIALANRMPVAAVATIMAAAAAAGTLAAWLWGGGKPARLTIAAALTVAPMLMVYAGTGPWQTDYHLYFFVVYGMLVAFVDWRPIVVAATVTALHHFLLSLAFPHAAFPEADIGRVGLHVAIVAVDSIVLMAIVRQISRLYAQSKASLAIATDALTSARLLESVVVSVNEAVIISETTRAGDRFALHDRRIIYVNAAFTKMTGYSALDLQRLPFDVLLGPNGTLSEASGCFDRVVSDGSGSYAGVWYSCDGRAIAIDASMVRLESLSTDVIRLITLARDVTESRSTEVMLRARLAEQSDAVLQIEVDERKNVEKRLAFAAFHDELTGLPNRSLFRERLNETLALSDHARRGVDASPEPAVVFIDLDRFKLVNDGLGHTIGDALLRAVAGRLRECLRDEDLLARLGGDEFTVLIARLVTASELLGIAERLLATFASPFEIAGRELYAAASIGIARGRCLPNDNADDMLRNADLAMYRAKALGRGRIELFVPSLLESSTRLLQLDTELRRALERSEIATYFQPIVQLGSERVCGFEALVRWRHPVAGLIPPDEFIGIAEESGLIVELGQYVLDASCAQLRRSRDEVPQCGDVWMSVNVSPLQLRQAGYLATVEATLARHGVSATLLHLEITESTIVSDLHAIAPILGKLRERGAHISIDDFGTGFSSLQYLDKLPIDTLKIDRSFVSGRGEGIANLKIVKTIVKLAQELGLDIVCEGVETVAQAEMLLAVTHGFGQGYLFSKALDAQGALDYLRASELRLRARTQAAR